MKVCDVVKINHPGYSLHGRRGLIVRSPYKLVVNGRGCGQVADVKLEDPSYVDIFAIPVSWLSLLSQDKGVFA